MTQQKQNFRATTDSPEDLFLKFMATMNLIELFLFEPSMFSLMKSAFNRIAFKYRACRRQKLDIAKMTIEKFRLIICHKFCTFRQQVNMKKWFDFVYNDNKVL